MTCKYSSSNQHVHLRTDHEIGYTAYLWSEHIRALNGHSPETLLVVPEPLSLQLAIGCPVCAAPPRASCTQYIYSTSPSAPLFSSPMRRGGCSEMSRRVADSKRRRGVGRYMHVAAFLSHVQTLNSARVSSPGSRAAERYRYVPCNRTVLDAPREPLFRALGSEADEAPLPASGSRTFVPKPDPCHTLKARSPEHPKPILVQPRPCSRLPLSTIRGLTVAKTHTHTMAPFCAFDHVHSLSGSRSSPFPPPSSIPALALALYLYVTSLDLYV